MLIPRRIVNLVARHAEFSRQSMIELRHAAGVRIHVVGQHGIDPIAHRTISPQRWHEIDRKPKLCPTSCPTTAQNRFPTTARNNLRHTLIHQYSPFLLPVHLVFEVCAPREAFQHEQDAQKVLIHHTDVRRVEAV